MGERGAAVDAGWWGRWLLGAVLLPGCAVGVDPEPDLPPPSMIGDGGMAEDGDSEDADEDADADTDGMDETGDADGSGGDLDDDGTTGDGDEGELADGGSEGGPADPMPLCGDGSIDPGEECDDGAGNGEGAMCTPDCQFAECGDGYHHLAAEECDDGNGVDTDACTNACTTATCGDGIVQAGVELCDDGNLSDSDGCTSTCSIATCGDMIVQPPEACDDGNASNTDGCLNTCLVASCGDGHVWAGQEACDDGNGSNTDACLSSCEQATCGDGYVWAGQEDCDGAGDPTEYSCSLSCEDQLVWYQWEFTQNFAPNPQACTDFNTWRNALAEDHTSIFMAGTYGQAGRLCTGPQATTLCNALRTGGNATVACDGYTWHVGANCLGAMEVTVDGTVCDCDFSGGWALRPCIGGSDWGGANTSTCDAVSQDIYIECGFG